jgi:hypothetical protein
VQRGADNAAAIMRQRLLHSYDNGDDDGDDDGDGGGGGGGDRKKKRGATPAAALAGCCCSSACARAARVYARRCGAPVVVQGGTRKCGKNVKIADFHTFLLSSTSDLVRSRELPPNDPVWRRTSPRTAFQNHWCTARVSVRRGWGGCCSEAAGA